MKLHFHGAAQMVTGSNHLLEVGNTKILIDCGLFQGAKHVEDKNYQNFPYQPKDIDFLLITHAHLDHIGRVPKLYKDGFRGKILATKPTKDFAKIMLEDSQGILENEARKLKRNPVYSTKDVKNSINIIKGVEYHKKINLTNNISCRFKDAGHILGSAMIELWIKDPEDNKKNKKIVFTGDIGNQPVPLLKKPATIKKADYIVIESTYGDRLHGSENKRKDLLENAIEDTVTKGGTLMIPAFALERTQELIYELNELVENHRIPKVPVFIDSPLAIKAVEVYRKHTKYYNKRASKFLDAGDRLFNFPRLSFTRTSAQSKRINKVSPPKVILAGSGMSTGGRILHHEIKYLPNSNNCLLIVSYQVSGSLGRKIQEGTKKVRIFNELISINAQVKTIDLYSSHADQADLYKWLSNFEKPVKGIFAVHGEKVPALELTQLIKDNLGIPATAPNIGDVVEL